MALTGMVPTIFGPGSGKFDNGIFVIQFVFKLAQKRTTWKIGLAWLPFLEDAIGVHVQDLLAVQFVEGLSVKMKACMDGGETGNENVHVRLHGNGIGHAIVHGFDHLLVGDAHGKEVKLHVMEQLMEFGLGGNGLDLRLVRLLPELDPEGI